MYSSVKHVCNLKPHLYPCLLEPTCTSSVSAEVVPKKRANSGTGEKQTWIIFCPPLSLSLQSTCISIILTCLIWLGLVNGTHPIEPVFVHELLLMLLWLAQSCTFFFLSLFLL